MYFEIIKGVLPRREIRRVVEISEQLTFVDGRAASNPESSVKKNLQGDINDPLFAEAGQTVQRALFRNQTFRDYAFPRRMVLPMVCKYEPGMEYGFHVDSALLANAPPPMRADVSTTVFLSDPDSYEGGELVARMGAKEIEVKLDPGDAIVYPSVTLHKVRPVTKGIRLVSIAFTESRVRDHYQRELLYTLGKAINMEANKLSFETLTELYNVQANLERYWIDH